MIKIAMIGAGSTVFMQNILTDVLLEDCFKDCYVALQDINEKRLKNENTNSFILVNSFAATAASSIA